MNDNEKKEPVNNASFEPEEEIRTVRHAQEFTSTSQTQIYSTSANDVAPTEASISQSQDPFSAPEPPMMQAEREGALIDATPEKEDSSSKEMPSVAPVMEETESTEDNETSSRIAASEIVLEQDEPEPPVADTPEEEANRPQPPTRQERYYQSKKRRFIGSVIGLAILLLSMVFCIVWSYRHIDPPTAKPAGTLEKRKGTTKKEESASHSQTSSQRDSSQTQASQGTSPSTEIDRILEEGMAQPNADTNQFIQDAKGTAQNHNKAASRYAYKTSAVRAACYGDDLVPGQKLAFLTYDDGIDAQSTPLLLDALKQEGVPATFFIIGNTIYDENKPYIERILQEGHGLGLHSLTHEYSQLYPNGTADVAEIVRQYKATSQALTTLLGKDLKISPWRYPGGHMSWDNMDAADTALRELGVEWIDWNSTNGDADSQPTTVDGQLAEVLKGWESYGSPDNIVILMHDRRDKTITRKAVHDLVVLLRERGFSFGIME